MNATELRKKRANLVEQARGILNQADAEKRELTVDEQHTWDDLHAEVDKLKASIDRIERQEQLDAEMRQSTGLLAGDKQFGESRGNSEISPEERIKFEREAFRSWLVNGTAGLNPEQRKYMATRMSSGTETRQLAAGSDSAGGYLVAEELVNKIETAMLPYDGIRKTRATIMRTNTGNDINMPTSNDTGNSGELLGENSDAAAAAMTFGSKVLKAYTFSSKIIKASLQFLQDCTYTDMENWIAKMAAERIGRIEGTYHIEGDGSNQPEGLENVAAAGVTAASVTAITYDELIDLEHSVNAAYRVNGEFLLSDGALKGIKKLKDGEGRPLWVPGIATKEPDTILGYRYAVAASMPAPAASEKTVYFGDFSKFVLRDVNNMTMLRLVERGAEYLQVWFLMFHRHDSILLDAGTNPIKYLAQAAG